MGPLGHSAAALAAVVGAPVGLIALALRPGFRTGWRERLGARPPNAPGAVWVHGASVGEAQAALRLLDGLAEAGSAVVASTTTLTGRTLLRETRPDLPVALAPIDHPWCVRAALARVDPSLLVLAETELWPAWIRAADERGAPVVVVSGRISDRSLPRYQRAAPLLRGAIDRLRAVGARSAADAERFVSLGVPAARVEVTGDLKLDAPRRDLTLSADLAHLLTGTPLLVAGSTHAGEEAAALDALEAIEAAGLQAALVIAPRHPERFDAAAREVERRGRRLLLRSRPAAPKLAAGQVLILDSVGELAAVYARADVAFVGGSLVPVGGHNLLEPAQVGRAVLFGPSTDNFRDAAQQLLACGGGRRVGDSVDLGRAAVEALRDPGAWAERGCKAAEEVARHRGATERTLALLSRVRGGGD